MEKKQSPDFIPYWIEIRRKVVAVLLSFIFGAVIGAINYKAILNLVVSGFDLENVNVVLTSPYQFINIAVGIGLTTGLITSSPFLALNILTFVRPALSKDEYNLIKRLIPISAILFIAGFAFGNWILQMVINIYVSTTKGFSVQNLWDIESFLSQIIIMGVSMGIVFQLPIILTGLLRFKIVKRSQLTKGRRFIYAGLLLFTVILPPTDILSLILIFLPLCLLFESALLFNRD